MEIKSYFYVVTSVIVVLALVVNLLPNSSSGKSAKTIISLIAVLAILSPIVNLFKGDDNLSVETGNYFNEYLQNYQDDLTESSVEYLLKSEGFLMESVKVDGVYFNGKYTVKKIFVKFKNEVITDGNEHINIIEKIKDLLESRLSIIGAEILIE